MNRRFSPMQSLVRFITTLLMLFGVFALLSSSKVAFGQTFSPAPFSKPQWFDNSGHPLNGGLLYSYISGTSTPKATYTNSTGVGVNANPVVLDTAGRADVWLGTGTYRLVLKTSAGVTLWTEDGITGSTGANSLSGSGTSNYLAKFTGTSTVSNSLVTESGGILAVGENLSVNGTTNLGGINYTWPVSQGVNTYLQNNGSGTLTWTAVSSASTTGGWTQAGNTIYSTILTSNVVVGNTSYGSYTGNTSLIVNGNGALIAMSSTGGPGTATIEISSTAGMNSIRSTHYGIGNDLPIDIVMGSSTKGRIQADGTFTWGGTTDSAYKMDIQGLLRVENGGTADAAHFVSTGTDVAINFDLNTTNYGTIDVNATQIGIYNDATAIYVFRSGCGSAGCFSVWITGDGEEFRVDDANSSTAATNLLINFNGALQRILTYNADSCGVGYRCLRIPNS